MAESNFVDYVKINCRSGKGGKGSMHLRHVKYQPNGGPDGGDGGRGGSIYLRGNHNYWTLLHLKYQRHFFAEHGGNGGRDKCHGTDGKDIYIDVPCGTVVYNAETGKYVCDVTYDGQEVLLLKGGRGGLGNFQFRTSTNQAPRYAQPGEPMQEMTIIMELKLLADVGLVGFPNAGKSTLLSAVSSARPKIANYPFTTLEPSLGIVDYRDHQSFVMADIPGIIEGASEGKGLGLRFLRHIERNSLLLFMVPGDTDDIKKEYEVLLGELKNFNPEMLDKHRVLAITKCDLLDDELIEMLRETLPTDLPVVFISSVTGQGIQELKDVLWKELNSESNKLQEITAEDTLVHRDKDMSRFQQELADEGEDIVEYIDEDEIEDVDDLGGVIDEVASGLNNKSGLLKVNYRLVVENHDLAVLVKKPIGEVLAKSAGNALDLRLALGVAVGRGVDNEVKCLGYLLLTALKYGKLSRAVCKLCSTSGESSQTCIIGSVARVKILLGGGELCIVLVEHLLGLGKLLFAGGYSRLGLGYLLFALGDLLLTGFVLNRARRSLRKARPLSPPISRLMRKAKRSWQRFSRSTPLSSRFTTSM